MKTLARYVLSIGVSAALLVGCGESQPPIGAPAFVAPSSTYPQKNSARSAGRLSTTVHYLYVTNGGSANVSAFAINASSGALTHVEGSPFAARSRPIGEAIDPTGAFMYVANGNSNDVSAYAINAEYRCLDAGAGPAICSGLLPMASGDQSDRHVRLRGQR